jgi:uncharacterized phage-associated protein
MRFVFDEFKAAQAASVLLDRHGGEMPYMKLIKLLYLADRAALIETGMPITGDRFVSAKSGPVLSKVLALVEEPRSTQDSVWHSYVARKHFDVRLIGKANANRLSAYELELLDEIAEAYGRWRPWAVVSLTQALPEWRDPGEAALPIKAADILRYSGYSEQAVEMAEEQASATYTLRKHVAAAR